MTNEHVYADGKQRPVRYRNLRSTLMMLAGLLGFIGAITTAVLRWPEWWWLVVGSCWLMVFTTVDNELDKPRRPKQ